MLRKTRPGRLTAAANTEILRVARVTLPCVARDSNQTADCAAPARDPRDAVHSSPSTDHTKALPAHERTDPSPRRGARPRPTTRKNACARRSTSCSPSEPRKSESTIKLNGRTLKYTAVAAFVPVTAGGVDDKRGEPEAAVFTTSYFLDDADAKSRPVCFVFNGGPGSASIWLHLGALGPKRVVIREDGTMPPPPYAVTDNQESWFEHFDLVFIDPPHTGYSITASEEARKKMLCVDGDVDALAEVMRAWLGRHRRWSSPVYLVGESYGTTRGAALADKLQDIGVALSGLILVSCAMDLQSSSSRRATTCPTRCSCRRSRASRSSTASSRGRWPNRRRPRASRGGGIRRRGVSRGAARRRAAVRTRRAGARSIASPSSPAFPPRWSRKRTSASATTRSSSTSCATAGLIVGRLEARVTGPMAASRTRDWEFDPGIEAIVAPYTMAAHAYMSEHLNVDTDGALRSAVDGSAQGSGTGTAARTRATASPARAPICRARCGAIRTCACWSRAAITTSARRTARATGRSRSSTCRRTCWRACEHHYYDAGHMMYTREADMMKLKRDLAAWLAE